MEHQNLNLNPENDINDLALVKRLQPVLSMRRTPPPHIHDDIVRAKLLEKYIAASSSPYGLLYVRAPAGYGKSTFLSQALTTLSENNWSTAWLTFSDDENDELQFYKYLIEIAKDLGLALSTQYIQSPSCALSIGCPVDPDEGSWNYQLSTLSGEIK